MQTRPPTPDAAWWQRRSPSTLVFLGVFLVLAVATVVVARQVADVLPEVPKDQLGDDNWAEPLGVELNSGFQVGRLPDCAAGSVTRIALWDADSNPYWEVSGPATPMNAFYIGVLPGGFTEVEPYREPPPGELVRLVVFRKVGGAAGLRYRTSQLRTGFVMSGRPLTSYTVEGFQSEQLCGETQTDGDDPGAVSTTLPG